MPHDPRLPTALLAGALTTSAASVAVGHGTAPTGLVVTARTDTSVALDWKQDYSHDYLPRPPDVQPVWLAEDTG